MAHSESSAVQLLCRAVELDKEAKYSESITCYEQGIRLLLQSSKDVTDKEKKVYFKKKAEEYLLRAEELKKLRQEQLMQSKHTQINIPKDATGYSYGKVFGPCLDSQLTDACIKDPYIRSTAQLYNLQRFCEALLLGAPNLKTVTLLTASSPSELGVQRTGLEELRAVLLLHNVCFTYTFSDTLHDREIRFNNGWTVQIGRGLDFFQRIPGGRFAIGTGDYNLRKCLETTIDIFHTSCISNSPS